MRGLPATTMNLYTVEQPVEAELPGISQVSIPDDEEGAGKTNQITMAGAIRALVRQNPDVVLVGEMRDEETVREAFTIATSGTSVIATVHADRAHNVFERIRYLFHVQPQQVQALLSCVVAQRLVRRVCTAPSCAVRLSGAEREANSDGCPACNFRGYAGEFAIIDIFEKRHGRWEYTTTMEQLAERAVREGITDRAEVHRVLGKSKLDYEPAASGLAEADIA
jgi:type II secretory ATPase GspE/PulE/Tfp pilus assembly ATPase PilB-like protein